MGEKPYIIGISGGSASGKTLFISRLRNMFNTDELCIVSQDEYYKPIHGQIKDKNGVENFDLPEAIDAEAFAKDIDRLISGEVIHKKEYTFNNPSLVPRMFEYRPAPVIIVEGIFVFQYEGIAKKIDLSIFLHAKKEVKLARRLKRDVEDRGYDKKHILYSQEHHVDPAYKKYIRPFKHEADLVIPNNYKGFDKGLEIIRLLIRSRIASANNSPLF